MSFKAIGPLDDTESTDVGVCAELKEPGIDGDGRGCFDDVDAVFRDVDELLLDAGELASDDSDEIPMPVNPP